MFVAGVDRLDADFERTSFGGRLEGGYRFGGPQYGLTPYAAVQVQSLRTPNYLGETASIGSNQFALTFASQTTTDTRSEVGFWVDKRHLFANGIVNHVLRGRVAWVHDFNPGSRINPAFQWLAVKVLCDRRRCRAARRRAHLGGGRKSKLPTNVTLIGKVVLRVRQRLDYRGGDGDHQVCVVTVRQSQTDAQPGERGCPHAPARLICSPAPRLASMGFARGSGGNRYGRRRRPQQRPFVTADTTTTNTANLNGATANSSDRIQEFNNGANIFAGIGSTVKRLRPQPAAQQCRRRQFYHRGQQRSDHIQPGGQHRFKPLPRQRRLHHL